MEFFRLFVALSLSFRISTLGHAGSMLDVNCVDINHGSFDCDGSKLATQGFALVAGPPSPPHPNPVISPRQTGCPLTEANLSSQSGRERERKTGATRNPCGNAVNDDLKQFADFITIPV